MLYWSALKCRWRCFSSKLHSIRYRKKKKTKSLSVSLAVLILRAIVEKQALLVHLGQKEMATLVNRYTFLLSNSVNYLSSWNNSISFLKGYQQEFIFFWHSLQGPPGLPGLPGEPGPEGLGLPGPKVSSFMTINVCVFREWIYKCYFICYML